MLRDPTQPIAAAKLSAEPRFRDCDRIRDYEHLVRALGQAPTDVALGERTAFLAQWLSERLGSSWPSAALRALQSAATREPTALADALRRVDHGLELVGTDHLQAADEFEKAVETLVRLDHPWPATVNRYRRAFALSSGIPDTAEARHPLALIVRSELDEAIQVLTGLGDPVYLGNALMERIRVAGFFASPVEVHAYGQAAAKTFQSVGASGWAAHALHISGARLIEMRRRDLAIDFLQRAEELFRSAPDQGDAEVESALYLDLLSTRYEHAITLKPDHMAALDELADCVTRAEHLAAREDAAPYRRDLGVACILNRARILQEKNRYSACKKTLATLLRDGSAVAIPAALGNEAVRNLFVRALELDLSVDRLTRKPDEPLDDARLDRLTRAYSQKGVRPGGKLVLEALLQRGRHDEAMRIARAILDRADDAYVRAWWLGAQAQLELDLADPRAGLPESIRAGAQESLARLEEHLAKGQPEWMRQRLRREFIDVHEVLVRIACADVGLGSAHRVAKPRAAMLPVVEAAAAALEGRQLGSIPIAAPGVDFLVFLVPLYSRSITLITDPRGEVIDAHLAPLEDLIRLNGAAARFSSAKDAQASGPSLRAWREFSKAVLPDSILARVPSGASVVLYTAGAFRALPLDSLLLSDVPDRLERWSQLEPWFLRNPIRFQRLRDDKTRERAELPGLRHRSLLFDPLGAATDEVRSAIFWSEQIRGADATWPALAEAAAKSIGLLAIVAHGSAASNHAPGTIELAPPKIGALSDRIDALDIDELSFDAGLVVLSVCEAAAGSDGSSSRFSLAEALHSAGARAVIAPINVISRAAAHRVLHGILASSRDERVSSALAAAKASMLRADSPPSDWAGVSLLGEDPLLREVLGDR